MTYLLTYKQAHVLYIAITEKECLITYAQADLRSLKALVNRDFVTMREDHRSYEVTQAGYEALIYFYTPGNGGVIGADNTSAICQAWANVHGMQAQTIKEDKSYLLAGIDQDVIALYQDVLDYETKYRAEHGRSLSEDCYKKDAPFGVARWYGRLMGRVLARVGTDQKGFDIMFRLTNGMEQ